MSGCVGQCWLKIPWRLWQTGKRYDPEFHPRNQLKHGSWVIGLMPAQNAQLTAAGTEAATALKRPVKYLEAPVKAETEASRCKHREHLPGHIARTIYSKSVFPQDASRDTKADIIGPHGYPGDFCRKMAVLPGKGLTSPRRSGKMPGVGTEVGPASVGALLLPCARRLSKGGVLGLAVLRWIDEVSRPVED